MNSLVHEELAQHLAAKGWRVVAVDVRGRGESGRRGPYSLESYREDIIDLLDNHLRVQSASFIGTSMGGLITLNVALLRPDLIDRSILNDIGPEIATGGLDRIRTFMQKQAGAAPLRIDNWESAANYMKERNAVTLPSFKEWTWLAKCLIGDDFAFRYDPTISLASPDALAFPDHLWSALQMLVKRPTLLIRGALSDLLSPETADAMVQKGCKLVTIPEVGHAPFLNEPESLSAIDSFMQLN
jgi:pimeloyl-ACP methyl ester carboxylesterase